MRQIAGARLTHGYFVLTAVLVALRVSAVVCGIVLGQAFWNHISSGIGDGLNLLLGAILGMAARRAEPREFLCAPEVYSALCLASGMAFVMASYSKAFSMAGMLEFFTQSGYSARFLKFIISAEVLGGIGLMIPWTVQPAIAGLSVDMFGAVYTHIHNGDPLNDSTGAIGQLIRLAILAVLWAWRPRPEARPGSTRRRIVAIALGAAISVSAAVMGSALVRRLSQPVPAAQSTANTP